MVDDTEAQGEERPLAQPEAVGKDSETAWTLLIIFGPLAVHRFYLRKNPWIMLAACALGVVFLTDILPDESMKPMIWIWLIGLFSWCVADAIRIPRWVRDFHAASDDAQAATDNPNVTSGS